MRRRRADVRRRLLDKELIMDNKEFLRVHLDIAITKAKSLPRSREASCVITKIEEAAMWLEKVENNG